MDKLGFLKAKVDISLKIDCLKDDFMEFLKTKIESLESDKEYNITEAVSTPIE